MERKLPSLTPETAPFWQGGSKGVLNICHCTRCKRLFHPPAPICPRCLSAEVGPRPVSGRGHVFSFTVNQQMWAPDLAVPYVVAIVELVEQPGLRFVSNVVGSPVDEIHVGMPVRVTFEQIEDVWLPLFERDDNRSHA